MSSSRSGRDASNAFDLHVDARMLAFTVALSMCAAFVFGLAPALRAARADIGEALKTQSRSVMGSMSRMPRVLVAVQIALSLSALVAAGLLGRSLHNLRTTDVGFDYDTSRMRRSALHARDTRPIASNHTSRACATSSASCLE